MLQISDPTFGNQFIPPPNRIVNNEPTNITLSYATTIMYSNCTFTSKDKIKCNKIPETTTLPTIRMPNPDKSISQSLPIPTNPPIQPTPIPY